MLVRGVAWRGAADLLPHLLLLPRIYIYMFALIVRRLAAASPDSLAAWRWWSGALAAACVAGLCGWRAPRGAGECGLLGNCGWIGCFSQPQCHSRYSSSFPNPLGHVFPPSSHTSLMRQPPTVARGARHRHRRRPPAMFRKLHISSTEAL